MLHGSHGREVKSHPQLKSLCTQCTHTNSLFTQRTHTNSMFTQRTHRLPPPVVSDALHHTAMASGCKEGEGVLGLEACSQRQAVRQARPKKGPMDEYTPP